MYRNTLLTTVIQRNRSLQVELMAMIQLTDNEIMFSDRQGWNKLLVECNLQRPRKELAFGRGTRGIQVAW
jgi:hypothetical protein